MQEDDHTVVEEAVTGVLLATGLVYLCYLGACLCGGKPFVRCRRRASRLLGGGSVDGEEQSEATPSGSTPTQVSLLGKKATVTVQLDRERLAIQCARVMVHAFAFMTFCLGIASNSMEQEHDHVLLKEDSDMMWWQAFVIWRPSTVLPVFLTNFISLFLVMIAWILCSSNPQALRIAVVIGYVCLAVFWLALQSVQVEFAGVIVLTAISVLMKMVLGMMMNIKITIPVNITICFCEVGLIGLRREDIAHNTLVQSVLMAVLGVVSIIGMNTAFHLWIVESARRTLHTDAVSHKASTELRLLSALCDAVVTLGPDLRISQKASKFANLLFQDGSRNALEGSLFLDFMADTDKQRFKDFVSRSPDWASSTADPMPAQALNVLLRDRWGSGVQVQLLHSHFLDQFDQVSHLLGICEVGDAGARGAAAEEAAPLPGRLLERHKSSRNNALSSRNPGTLSSIGTPGEGSVVSGDLSIEDSVSVAGRDRDTLAPLQTPHEDNAFPPLPTISGYRKGEGSPSSEVGQRSVDGRREGYALPARPDPGKAHVLFDRLHCTVNHMRARAPVLDVDLRQHDAFMKKFSRLPMFQAWIEECANMLLLPVTAESWPSQAGAPSSVCFTLSVRCAYGLPADFLGRVPSAEAGHLAARRVLEQTNVFPRRVELEDVSLVHGGRLTKQRRKEPKEHRKRFGNGNPSRGTIGSRVSSDVASSSAEPIVLGRGQSTAEASSGIDKSSESDDFFADTDRVEREAPDRLFELHGMFGHRRGGHAGLSEFGSLNRDKSSSALSGAGVGDLLNASCESIFEVGEQGQISVSL
eukprot:TRINITY_DN31597_c0_g1_i1.p1 TRINITY_DN31597_c0_g1~~TRINITY_DN31597_c0_g1_i1.p1  ORF type:complete len:810 (+),score=147.11 TRINITY_DN31597_c0_g1_i1:125-2554(+)